MNLPEHQPNKLDKLLNLPKLPRRGTSRQDSSQLQRQEPPVWDSPNLISLARYNDLVLEERHRRCSRRHDN